MNFMKNPILHWEFCEGDFLDIEFGEGAVFLILNFVKGPFFYVEFCEGAVKRPQMSPGSTIANFPDNDNLSD